MADVILHPAARAELRVAAAYYEMCRSRLGNEFLAHVEKAFVLVLSSPRVGSIIRVPYRRFIIRRFPYGIIYRQTENVIYVVAIMHLKRRPEYWSPRTESTQKND